MSRQVEIYDQYSTVYINADTDELEVVNLMPGQTLNQNLTLLHASSGSTSIAAIDLTETEALDVVANLYNVAKATGVSTVDRIVRLDEGYAEVAITFADGKRLNRVIYIK